jgi:hypothetical protein
MKNKKNFFPGKKTPQRIVKTFYYCYIATFIDDFSCFSKTPQTANTNGYFKCLKHHRTTTDHHKRPLLRVIFRPKTPQNN